MAEALHHFTKTVSSVTSSQPTSSRSEPHVSVHQETTFNCGCKFADGQPCIGALDPQAVQDMRHDTEQLTHDELDMVILGQLAASQHASHRTNFSFGGHRICRETFLFLHNISTKRLKALQSHYGSNGLTPRVHKNKKWLPHNTTPFLTVQDIVRFLLNLAQEQGLVLPGRVPGYHRTDIQLLPSSTTKLAVWKKYCVSCGDSQNLVSRATFTTYGSSWYRKSS